MNSLSTFLVDSILEDTLTADTKPHPIIDTVIPKEVVQEWVIHKFPKLISEITTTTPGTSEVDDGPNFFFRNYKDFDTVSRRRAEHIGYEVLKQLYDETFEDITVYREYPNGPVKAVTPFPAGVIGKTTTTNQKDFDTPYAYRLWYRHVTRLMGLVGYTLVGDIDDLDRKLSITQAKDLKTDETAQEPSSVNESKLDTDLTEVMDDISTVLDELMIGYEGEADKKKREKRLKKLRKQLDTTTPPLNEEKFDKLDFYLNYYKNLSPSNFIVQTKDKDIVISLNKINEDTLNERSVNAGIYRGPIKVDGRSVEIEVELYGADNTNRTYKTRIMWVPSSLKNRFKVGQEFPIPAKAFHAPRMGSGWRRVKVSGMFENKVKLPKSLGIPRSQMPQVSSRNMSDYIQFLKSNGVVVKSKKFKVSDVKMTQKEINQDKVLGLMKGDNREHLAKPVVISKDGYIMDGHHRILALYNLDNRATINTIWVNLPIRKLLDITFDYPKVFTKNVEEDITIPIEVGDTILTGRFKNKKTKVNTIGNDEHGMPTVNGRKVVNFRKEKVDVNEAEFILKPGFTFVAQKTLGDIKRGVKYVIKGVDGAIGNLIFTLKPTTKNELIPIKSRSYSEFYSKVMNLSEIIDPGEPETGYIPDGKERKLDDGRPEPWLKHLGFTQVDFPKADRMRGWGKTKDKESSFRKVYYKTQNVKKNKLSDVLQPESPDKWKEINK